MNNQLTRREKKSRKAEARERAILWSKNELRKCQLNQSQQWVKTIPISNNPYSSIPPETNTYWKNKCKSNKGIVSRLLKNIYDLKIQRQELDITIKVLPSKHLEQITKQVQTPSKRSKPDGY